MFRAEVAARTSLSIRFYRFVFLRKVLLNVINKYVAFYHMKIPRLQDIRLYFYTQRLHAKFQEVILCDPLFFATIRNVTSIQGSFTLNKVLAWYGVLRKFTNCSHFEPHRVKMWKNCFARMPGMFKCPLFSAILGGATMFSFPNRRGGLN